MLNQRSLNDFIQSALEADYSFEEMTEHTKNSIVELTLALNAGNKSATARKLKTHRNNLVRWIYEARAAGPKLD